MRLRTPIVLTALFAVVAALLAALPAEAASYKLYVKSSRIAISSSGTGKVAVKCSGSKTCKGKISFADDTGTPRTRSYSVKGGKSVYVAIALHTNAPDNPHNAPAVPGRDYKSVSNVSVKVDEDSPRNITHFYNKISTETLVSRQEITGQVTGVGSVLAKNIRVDLIKTLRGGNVQIVKGQDVTSNGGSYSLAVNLGANNSPSSSYRLRISGSDQDGIRRSWYWRGADDKPTGGGAHLRDAVVVQATKSSNFDADFVYGSISGTTAEGADITVASLPPSYSGGSSVLRELDIPYCANVFGRTEASGTGSYAVTFLPMTSSLNNRYMVGARNGKTQAWYGEGNERYGSCYDATDYKPTRANLITLTAPVTGKSISAFQSDNNIKINGVFSPSYKPTSQGDRWIRLREKIPNLPILDSPVVAEGQGDSSGNRTFSNLAPGKYWVEVGRRTGCSDWYPSRFPDNSAYFKGLDRSSEKWKAFKRLRDLSGNADGGFEYIARTVQPNPARGSEQNRIVSGYKGWMYRGYCKAYGAGTINTMDVNGTGQSFTKTTSRNGKGAVVKGRVTRTGGRTPKEMMVRLSSSAGTRVIRTDITDGSGVFYIAGLPSGRWTISVNSDSWRGISRSFSGRHSVTVRAGKGYNVGTLRFKG
ncbi:carboxypeptidase-like regulatory domain-containing protein [Aeromicrobium stalagmiti]|uniref:carboxypeptidase-like regulatory domain-containing protein n=1 Tax=Aeromicrobium stalagmiti TaxID=2738988 RepID=UPI00156967D3|nr:carboxypeptidase-like regulatory domain-containing protein [Aeromicrobium stalagmiti]NRQ50372.1 carboxypeptidase regulatory-like domain-containing protein [Aeromicrobium stalagmiti]